MKNLLYIVLPFLSFLFLNIEKDIKISEKNNVNQENTFENDSIALEDWMFDKNWLEK